MWGPGPFKRPEGVTEGGVVVFLRAEKNYNNFLKFSPLIDSRPDGKVDEMIGSLITCDLQCRDRQV